MFKSKLLTLRPFIAVGGQEPPYALEVVLQQRGQILTLDYALKGDSGLFVLAPLAERPGRRQSLWEHTCFEFFLAPAGSNCYWEFNLAPSGAWNLYRFSGYRQGMAEDQGLRLFPLQISQGAGVFRLACELELDLLLVGRHSWQLGVCAVVEEWNGARSYWALAHSDGNPDFHRRDSFIVEL